MLEVSINTLKTFVPLALVYATIFGNITTIVQQMYSARTRYNDMMKGVKDFLKIHDVPQELGERVVDYVTSSWATTKGIDTIKVIFYFNKHCFFNLLNMRRQES
ncbi:unnamed protein product [Protopolystoma xenopodis]|uniref:Uncharacterized protein n=1 Tax=Protopolystoma xenopodis TaxID=117903 RepID=A0A448XT95_9PLAT|nr:unnamed protein product [Protopolystoma xenopodis]